MHVLVHVHHYFSLPVFFAPLDEKKKPSEKEKETSCVILLFFLRFFFSRSLDVHLFLSDHFFSLSLSTIFFSEGISMYKCSLFYYNTFNRKQYSYGLTSYQLFFFFDFEGYLIVPFFSLFYLSIARD